mmetsp:Transcript_22306/g.63828  ORF Transcript_22306/g.63828 Transcript_22306/m.63828 type:complete len:257 (+) Transcript_22306:376-1146(+)
MPPDSKILMLSSMQSPDCSAKRLRSFRMCLPCDIRLSIDCICALSSSRSLQRRNCSPRATVSRAGKASGPARRTKAFTKVCITGKPPFLSSNLPANFMTPPETWSLRMIFSATHCKKAATFKKKKNGVSKQMRRAVNTLAQAPQKSPRATSCAAKWKAMVPGTKVQTMTTKKFQITATTQIALAKPNTSSYGDLRNVSSRMSASCTSTVQPMKMSRRSEMFAVPSSLLTACKRYIIAAVFDFNDSSPSRIRRYWAT